MANGRPGKPKGSPKTGGRKKGTPNRISGDIKKMILDALDDLGGKDYLVEQGKSKNASAFMSLIGKAMPLQIANPEGEAFRTTQEVSQSDKELIQRFLNSKGAKK